VATGKLEFGIVLQKTWRDAINLASVALKISWLVALISLLFVGIFHKNLGEYYGIPEWSYYFLLLPLYILLSAFSDTANYWYNRLKKFNTIALNKVVQTSHAESSKLVFGLLNFNFSGLILGRVLGFVASSVFYTFTFLKRQRKALRLINKKDETKVLKANKDFIMFSTPSVFLGSAINFTYLNLFQHFYGKEIVGNIGVSMLYLATGFGLISLSFSQVFYSKLSEIESKKEMLRVYLKFAKNLLLVCLLPLLLVFLIPSSWIVAVLGDDWQELIYIARIMSVWLSIWFVSSSLSFIYIRLGKQKQMLIFDVLHLGLIVAGFFIGKTLMPDVFGALWGFSIGQVIYYLLAIFLAVFFIKRSKILKD
jgi:O-antigen/teichoic acid export membrane protein